jgi:LysR family transcriptional regulator (chromosome initiation inhibitor)
MQLDSAQLTALAQILRLGSFDAAAAALGVTPSAISQRVKALEDRVGATLVLRGQPCTGTPMGQRLAKHAEDVALLEAQALGASDTTAHPGCGWRCLRMYWRHGLSRRWLKCPKCSSI